jgi:hypothetical protein
MRTATPVDLALFEIIKQARLADEPAVRKLDPERALRSGGQLAGLSDFFTGALSNIGRLFQTQQRAVEDLIDHVARRFELAHPVREPMKLGGERSLIVDQLELRCRAPRSDFVMTSRATRSWKRAAVRKIFLSRPLY